MTLVNIFGNDQLISESQIPIQFNATNVELVTSD